MAGENDAAAGLEPASPDNRPDAEAGWESDSSSVGKFPGAAADEAAAAGAGGERAEAAGAEGDGDGDEAAAAEAARVDRMRDGRGRFAAKTGTATGDAEAARVAAGGEPAGAGKDAAAAADAAKSKDTPTAKRLKLLDAKARRHEREAAGWRDRALQLENELKSARGKPTGDAARGGADGDRADGDRRADAPKFKYPTFEQYLERYPEATHEEYIDARGDARERFRASERQAADSQMSAQVEHEEVTRSYAGRMAAYKAAHPDFEEALETGGDIPNSPAITHIAMLSERSGQILHTLVAHQNEARVFASLSMPRPVAEFIADSPIAESLMLHIGKHPTEFNELLDGGPVRGMRALVELERSVQAARNPRGSAAAAASTKRPSAPIRPVGAGGAAGGSADAGHDDDEFGPDWVQRDNERDRRNGRRR